MTDFTEQETLIVLKTELIASVFAEYLSYYKPILDKMNKIQVKSMNRKQSKEHIKQQNKDFAIIHKCANSFAKINERDFPEQYDKGIDLIHESLKSITISKE